jgi:5-methylcytosine-specific restriction endonuclease McrA
MTRVCRKCEQEKPITSFPKRYGRRRSHLREHTCGMCKLRAWRQRNSVKRALQDDRRRARAKGVSVEVYLQARANRAVKRSRLKIKKRFNKRCPVLIHNKRYDLAQRQLDAARSRDYYQRNLNKARAKVKRWKQANPAKRSAQHYRERVRRSQMFTDLTETQWAAMKLAYRYRCAYCHKRKRLTQDHVIPVSKGGTHTANNIVPACQSCNSSKGARLPCVGYQPHLIL